MASGKCENLNCKSLQRYADALLESVQNRDNLISDVRAIVEAAEYQRDQFCEMCAGKNVCSLCSAVDEYRKRKA